MPDANEHLQDLLIWRSRVDVELDEIKQGVTNFRAFQTRCNKYFDRFEAIAYQDAKRAKRRLQIAAILAVLVIPPATWVSAQTVKFCQDLYQITQEWHDVHKTALDKKSFFDPPQPAYTDSKKPQDAGLPSSYQTR